jgi:endonuclease YncB( thermonuclease family)
MKRALFAFALLFAYPAIADEHYAGTATSVSDGDTFHLSAEGQDIKVRLCGVDSPERGQPGYGYSAGELAKFIEGKQVACIQVGGGTPCDGRSKTTNRDRIVAQCFVGDKDVGMEMVCSKAAVDLPRFSGGYYAACKH